MKLIEHYIKLYEMCISKRKMNGLEQERTHIVQIKIEDIQAELGCTKRHTKWLIKRLQEQQWIEWQPARGRGKISSLTFLVHPDEIKVEQAKELIQEGKYELGLKALTNIEPALKEQFHHWLSGQLGYMIEVEGSKKLDILRYPFYPTNLSLDPAQILSRHDAHMVGHIFDPLLQYDHHLQQIVPHLAHHWESEQGAKIWRFYLRKGIKFHHGRELVAQDVVQTFQRFSRYTTSEGRTWQQFNLEEIKAVDTYTVQFCLSEPNALLPHYLCYPHSSIIPLEVWEKDPEAFRLKPIGTGPFKVLKHDQTILALEAFELYFKGRVQLDRVEILTLPKLTYQENQLINYTYDFSEKRIETEKAKEEGKKTTWIRLEKVEEGASYYTFNLNKQGPQQNRLFRQALYSVLPISKIGEELGFGNYSPAYSHLPAISAEHPEHEAEIELAKKLLTRTGLKQPAVLKIGATQLRPKANHGPEALWLQENWSKLGVHSEVHIVPIYELAEPECLAQFDVIVGGVAFGQSPLISLVKTLQNPLSFICNMLDLPLKKMLLEAIQQVRHGAEHPLQLLLKVEKELTQAHILQFLKHRAHSVHVNVGSTLKGVRLNYHGRVDYKSLWFTPE